MLIQEGEQEILAWIQQQQQQQHEIQWGVCMHPYCLRFFVAAVCGYLRLKRSRLACADSGAAAAAAAASVILSHVRFAAAAAAAAGASGR